MDYEKRLRRLGFTAGMMILIGGLLLVSFTMFPSQPVREEVAAVSRQVTFFLAVIPLFTQEPDQVLLMPVPSVSVDEIVDTWGAPRSEGRVHEGQDIFAARGAPVYSATDGYVLSVREGGRGGKYVYVIGSGGRRYYYAHLDAHAPDLNMGDRVTTDTLLGFVGNTGNAEQTPPHLHFGVYEGWEAMDPLPLLVNRIHTEP